MPWPGRVSAIVLLLLAWLTAGCSGPAVCGPFDDGCRQAARVLQQDARFEPIAVRDVVCHPGWDPQPLRCLEFVNGAGERLGAAILADGLVAPFEP